MDLSPTREPSYALEVPALDDRVFVGAILDRVKAPDRVPPGRGPISLLASPYASPDLLERPDDEVVSVVAGRAERYLPGLAEATREARVVRRPVGLPEATPAALRLRRAFLDRPARRVDYAGDRVMLRPNSEAAVRSAEIVAHRVLSADAR
ncbi:hypothetical protein [Streptomyces sp. NPDC058424]|uniref:hypothetical protein n=1 Tax=Streptomyces sp. NPDC058424 TaxID=3346491 RepID=UPI0036615DA9